VAGQTLVTAWNADPVTLALLVVLLGGYLLALGPLRARILPGGVVSRGRVAAYVGGVALLALTLLSPLDALGRDYLLTARMTQLMILVTLVAPLLMIGLPEALAVRLLPVQKWREATGSLLFIVIAVVGFNALVLVWQVPRFYELSIRDNLWHEIANLSYLAAGVLTWWPLLTPTDRQARLSSPLQMVYLALESLPIDIFGVAIIFAPAPLYATYLHAPRITALSAMADQQVAGALLALPGNILDIFFMSIIFFVWIERMERAQRRHERVAIERELADTTNAMPGESATHASEDPVSSAQANSDTMP
jgi:putative membrane protein